ncbi:hypothetical protein IV203_032690 [Nitzschia inconspicua]|uniref:Uncharacterized protein n=1 Tax=Nitzschia inconspicua TaxID=303405 RepID=A0A9K3KL83_9STRA|nr:hypothetical protein IV203_032690 [Nitzschia inconspicua]
MQSGLDSIPSDVWNNFVTPCIDRNDWNAIRVASKAFYLLTEAASKPVAPPWPQRCYGVQGAQSIATFTISHDGEYMAVGSVIGSIEIWSRRKGKIRFLRNKESLTTTTTTETDILPFTIRHRNASSALRSSQKPVGSVVKFAPVGYTLASAHENRIFLQEVSDNPRGGDAASCKRLEITCQHGKIYEVTYLGFSHDATTMVARYGKTAYIWKSNPTNGTTDPPIHTYTLAYQLSLSSSRSQMASSPCLNVLAVTSASSGSSKGTIDVWNLHNVQNCHVQNSNDGNEASCCCKIEAHPEQFIRGLEFLSCQNESGPLGVHSHYLISATLQGEVKCWKYNDRPSKQNENDGDDASSSRRYVCIRSFRAKGRIFSLALFVPSSKSGTAIFPKDCPKHSIYLAVGQARGQVRAWKFTLDGGVPIPKDATQLSHEDTSLDSSTSGISAVDSSANANSDFSSPSSSNDMLQEFLAVAVGEHVHHDNIKLLTFTPDGRNLVASRAFDNRIWFHFNHGRGL